MPARMPRWLPPQLATLVDVPPAGDDWLHEVKLDGYRILCHLEDGAARLVSRNAKDWTARFAAIAEAAERLPASSAVLDGEVVVLDEAGRSSFQRLQDLWKRGSDAGLAYFVFDLLYLDGFDLRGAPLEERKRALAGLLRGRRSPRLRYNDHVVGRGDEVFGKACSMGLEGIVSKKRDRPHVPRRGRDWLKVKCLKRQEFVIGGFTDPERSRSGLGALLVGVNDGGKLVYAGKVGTGFTAKSLVDLRRRLEPLERKTPPFANPPRGAGARGAHWVEPRLVGEVAFTEWTREGNLRHPSFQGLREDKKASEVVREEPRRLAEVVGDDAAPRRKR